MKFRHLLALASAVALASQVGADEVAGRYIRVGAALSPTMSLAEIEVWSGGKNLTTGHPELITNDALHKRYRGELRQLVDGNKDTNQRQVELTAPGAGGYQDAAAYYSAVEIDLGATFPIDKVDIYRARHTYKPPHWVQWDDLFWRYMVVLDEQRRVVAYEAFNVFEPPFPDNKGLWSFSPKPAKAPVAGRIVPERSRSWLSEAEYIRDFLGKPVVDKTAPLTAEARERLSRYERRNDPKQIEALGRKFFRRVDLDQPGLEQVKSLVAQEKFAEALEAFKKPFFASLQSLDEGLATAHEYSWSLDAESRDVMRARDLANGVACDRSALTVEKFVPGLMPLSQLAYPFQTRPLLISYAATRDSSYLRAWEALTDDWAIAFQREADKDPEALRDYFVLIAGPLRANLSDLLNASRDVPSFVDELSGATLARYLLPIMEEIPVSIWRVTRKCVFNHTFNATAGSLDLSTSLDKFLAGQRLNREMRQGLQRLHTLAQYRDGVMVESQDEGHFIFEFLSPSRVFGALCVSQPEWFTPGVEAYMLAHLRNAELSSFRHTSPSGMGIRWETSIYNRYPTFEGRYDREFEALKRGDLDLSVESVCGLLQRLSVVQETEPRAIAEKVYGWAHYAHRLKDHYGEPAGVEPTVVSDFLPYAGAYYFRRGWERSDSFLHMLAPAISNNINSGLPNPFSKSFEELTTTSWRFQDYGTPLLTIFGTEIDEQAPCPQYGRYPSGSKQDIFTQAVEKPQPRRWHTDAQLDFGEALYEGAYHYTYRFRRKYGDKWKIEYEDDPRTIHGVTTSRQIFQIRPARLFLQIERVKYDTPQETHENRTNVSIVLTEPGPETKEDFSNGQLEVDQDSKRIVSRNPGNAGMSLMWFGQPSLEFRPFSINGSTSGFWPQKTEVKVNPGQDAKFPSSVDTPYGKRRTTGRGVYATWRATGESVVLTALRAHMADEAPIAAAEDISTDTVAGSRIDMADGVTITLLSARKAPATLRAGDVSITGEALLLVTEPHKPAYGIALGAKDMAIRGAAVDTSAPDFRFDLTGEGLTQLSAIHRPLDPPTIEPGVNTFTDSAMVTLRTSSPDAEIRYTTAPPNSRLNEFKAAAEAVLAGKVTMQDASKQLAITTQDGADWQVYTGPFRIDRDTVVRARTFRRGVSQVPALAQSGVDVSEISFGFFFKRDLEPAATEPAGGVEPGLAYDYMEDRWFALWSYSDVLPAKKTGQTDRLFDVSMRETDGPFGVRYKGYLKVPTDGVYTFYGPHEFFNNECEPGYDLRVYVDGEEWYLGQTWHGRGQWSIPLQAGLHEFMVSFADARAKDIESQRVDLWSLSAGGYPRARTTWRGTAPQLDVSGPGTPRQPLPDAWLMRPAGDE